MKKGVIQNHLLVVSWVLEGRLYKNFSNNRILGIYVAKFANHECNKNEFLHIYYA